MRLLKIFLLNFVLLFLFSHIAYSQIIDCSSIAESPNDTVRLVSTIGAPGDTVAIPLWVKNDTGIATFSIYVEFDSTVLKPIVTGVDSLKDSLGNFQGDTVIYYDYLVHGRFLKTDVKYDSSGFPYLDTTTYVQVVSENEYPSPLSNMQRVKVLALLKDFSNPKTVIIPGADTIMFLRFVVQNNVPNNTLASMDFYDETIEIRDSAGNIVRTSCLYSRYSDSTGTIDRRFTVYPGTFKVDTSYNPANLPVINSFTANPSTISSGGSSQLSWDVTNADQVVIDNGVGTFTNLTGSATVSPTATTTYTLTATNTYGSSQASATVTISGTGNNSPVVNPVTGSPFTVNQGETVTFSVTATDADAGDIITLKSVSLPSNANFSTVTGSGSVTGNFSFTPDFTQSGSLVATFQATDDRGGTSNLLSVIINVVELQNDRLFSTSALGQQPVGGLKGKKGISFPINLVTSQTVYGVQFDFYYNYLYFSVDSFVVTGRIPDYVVYDNIGQTPGAVRVVTFGLANEPVVNVTDTTAVLYAVMSIDSAAPVGDYPIYIENGWESVNPDPNFPSLELVTDSGIIQVDNPGDVNLDKRIDVADLVNIVAYIINNFTLSERQFDVADVVVNDTVDVFDLVGVINMIYGIPLSPHPVSSFGDQIATINLNYNDIPAGGNEMMVVHSELPTEIAAVEMEISYDPGSVSLGEPSLAADADRLTLRYKDNNNGKLKVLLHFTNPFDASQLISEGAADLIKVPILAKGNIQVGDKDQLRITQALLSTSSAAMVNVEGVDHPQEPLPSSFSLSQNYPNPFNPTTTIDFSIDKSQNVNLDIYNILGQQVRSLIHEFMQAGEHSVEWDATDNMGRRVASGIYLYKLHTDKNTKTKKMLFLK